MYSGKTNIVLRGGGRDAEQPDSASTRAYTRKRDVGQFVCLKYKKEKQLEICCSTEAT